MERFVTSTNYVIELDVEDFKKILKRDYVDIKSLILAELLENLDGVSDVNYDGMLGPNIFFTLDNLYEASSSHEVIERVIRDYMEGRPYVDPK